MSDPLSIAQSYFDAWNHHDTDAIVETFIESGTYDDPTTGRITGTAIGSNARRLFDAFPDLAFEIVSVAESGPGTVVAEWLMKGTNTGSFLGLPPSGRTVELPGADFIRIEGEGIKSVRGYFDTRGLPEQLGLEVIVQPHEAGPFRFGWSSAVHSGKLEKPGAFGITSIWNADEHMDEVRSISRDIAREMLGMEGFIGVTLVRIGGLGVTISAWETPENIKQIMKSAAHGKAMKHFWEYLGQAAYTSVWVPHHINAFWVRCGACNKMVDYEAKAGVCNCGAALPERPTYF